MSNEALQDSGEGSYWWKGDRKDLMEKRSSEPFELDLIGRGKTLAEEVARADELKAEGMGKKKSHPIAYI